MPWKIILMLPENFVNRGCLVMVITVTIAVRLFHELVSDAQMAVTVFVKLTVSTITCRHH